jgi:iron complex outermembrane recepter protein
MNIRLGAISIVGAFAFTTGPGLERALGDEAPTDGLEPIVVTAARSAQKVTEVPMSVQAISGDQLVESGIHDLTSLQFSVPGYLPSSNSGYTQIFIRGVGNNIYAGADPSVATYIDDVPRIYGSLVDRLVDVDRIEILKGAQGGLYGRNATGGVVNIITHQPSTDGVQGSGTLSYGEHDTLRVGGYVNLPVTTGVAVLLSAERDQHHPYVQNISRNPTPYTADMFPGGTAIGSGAATASVLNSSIRPPDGVDNQNFWSASAKVLIKPVDNFKITIEGDYSKKDDSDGGQLFLQTPAYNQAVLQGTLSAFLGGNPQLPPGFIAGYAGKFTTSQSSLPRIYLKDTGTSLTAVWGAPEIDVTSISAYRKQSTFFSQEVAADTVPVYDADVGNEKRFFYQELRAVSTGRGPFHWLGGATYLDNTYHTSTITDIIQPIYSTDPILVKTDIQNESVYGQLAYDITDHVTTTVSGRYIHEKNDTSFTAPVISDAEIVASRFLPSVTVSYRLQEGTVYARWARGFKAGGVNPIAAPSAFPDPQSGSQFRPEQVDTYEIGYRQSLWGDRIETTSALFYNNYQGLQLNWHALPQFQAQIIQAIINAGSARSWGVEQSIQWRIAHPLIVGINAGYLNARYKDFELENSPVLESFDLSGSRMLNSPQLQLGFTADLDVPLNDRFHLVGGAMQSYVSEVIFSKAANAALADAAQPGYWLTNLRLGLRTSDGRYELAGYCNNVFDRAYITYGESAAGTGNKSNWGNPRIAGAELRVNF